MAEQTDDPNSLLSFYRRLLQVRKKTPALIAGDYTPLEEEAEDYLAFLRSSDADAQARLVILNMSDRAHTLALHLAGKRARLTFSSRAREGDSDDLAQLRIAPFEVYVAEIV